MTYSLMPRRQFLATASATVGSALAASTGWAAPSKPTMPICCFVKFVQSLNFDELAERMAEIGFTGIEATVRKGGQISPENAADELPRLVEALAKRGLEVTIMTSNVNRADDPLSENLLRTAAGLGIKRYRMDYYHYDLNEPILPQLNSLRPVVRNLAALNAELGIQGLYQNHSGAKYVGSPIWDFVSLIEDIPAQHMAMAYDINHATVEGGLNWPVQFNLARPHLGAIYAKDFRWEGSPRAKPEGVRLGSGQIDTSFFASLRKINFAGPVSLHVEYLPKGTAEENVAEIAANYQSLQKLLK